MSASLPRREPSSVRLTPLMRSCLEQLTRQPLRRTADSIPVQWPHPATLNALLRHDLAEHHVGWNLDQTAIQESLAITNKGRQALEPKTIHRREPIRYLAPCARPEGTHLERLTHPDREDPTDLGYTTRRHKAVDDDPVLDPPHPEWARRADRRHARELSSRVKNGRLARAVRRAA